MTRDDILKAFPAVYQHTGLFDFSPPDGWLPMIYELSSKLNDFGVQVIQVKSKFGGLRVYLDNGNYPEEVNDLIRQYGDKCMEVCETCGAPGNQASARGWVRTACEAHSG